MKRHINAYWFIPLAVSLMGASNSPIDPCTLLTKDEIQQQLELSGPQSQSPAPKKEGVAWSITMEPEPRGSTPVCRIQWRRSVNGDVQRKGEFAVVATSAGWLKGSVAAMKTPLPIANVGDAAIGIEDFPDTRQSKSGLDLLRAAVSRARGR
jgi:hypothetical protein